MNPARCRSDRFGDTFQKRDDVMIRSLFDVEDPRNGKPRPVPNLRSVLFRNLAKLCHRVTGEHFNFQPDFKLSLVRPDFAHLWPGITVDHVRKIKRLDGWKSVFVPGRADLRVPGNDCKPVEKPGTEVSKSEPISRLADAGAQETSVILNADLAAGQKIRNRCDHFSAAFGAGADCQDQITQ